MTSEEHGTVVSVNVSTEKGTVKEPVAEALVTTQGLEGDAHAGDWQRQVSLLASESIQRMAAETGHELVYGQLGENVTTQGLDLSGAAILDRFILGQAELEVTQRGKECHGNGCAVFREVGECVMPQEGIFCRVLVPGPVRPGTAIVLYRRPFRIQIVTVSDRASRGAYEDKSGPAAEECLCRFFDSKPWHLVIERSVVPDDADALEGLLREARESEVDVVVTTGGTGIGPRDVTPDVVAALADRTIPGIMDAIRMQCGRENPNALLSRSVAAVVGPTLVYTLPGSVRAVQEYMPKVLETLEHAVLMLHGIDAH